MTRIHRPTQGPEDWKQFLADPEKHWKPGYSAHSTAYAWEVDPTRLPAAVREVLESSGNPALQGLELLFAIPEFKVPLKGGSRPSQNDVFALARNEQGLVVIMVEGKSLETFDTTIGEWLRERGAEGVTPEVEPTRLKYLREVLGLRGTIDRDLRYQLLHRTASALLVARQFHAATALLIVQAFNAPASSFLDYAKFLRFLGKDSGRGQVTDLGIQGAGPHFFAAWVDDSAT